MKKLSILFVFIPILAWAVTQDMVRRVPHGGTIPSWGPVNLAGRPNSVTGTLPSTNFGYSSYSTDAAFVSAKGVVAVGDTYLNTVAWATRFYDGSNWQQNPPPGTMMQYGGTTAPAGWLMEDGVSYLKTTYANLYANIGCAFGCADSTHFNVPDSQGRFFRAVDGTAGRDPDKAVRTAMATGGNTGNNVGSIQGYATAKPVGTNFTSNTESATHTHSYSRVAASGDMNITSYGNLLLNGYYADNTGTESATHTHSIGPTAGSGGDSETRTINIYVYYIIKI